ncbi:MAG: hypothetical protein ACRERU_14645, partial [Methylococcales bacterium]
MQDATPFPHKRRGRHFTIEPKLRRIPRATPPPGSILRPRRITRYLLWSEIQISQKSKIAGCGVVDNIPVTHNST